jgi:hypothetical protein
MRGPVLCLLAASVFFAGVRTTPAQTLTPKEFTCMVKSTARAETKFVTAKLKCVSKCFYEFWHSGENASDADCLPPYGGVTAACLTDALKGAESKFTYSILKDCVIASGADCPECYEGGNCTETGEASTRVEHVTGQLDSFVQGIFCERDDAMPQEQWCQRGVAKALAKFYAGQNKCYAKCFTYAQKGIVSAATCSPPGSDPVLGTCLFAARAKSIGKIDDICNDDEVPHSEPECGGGTYPDGATWTNLADIWVAGNVASHYCGH